MDIFVLITGSDGAVEENPLVDGATAEEVASTAGIPLDLLERIVGLEHANQRIFLNISTPDIKDQISREICPGENAALCDLYNTVFNRIATTGANS